MATSFPALSEEIIQNILTLPEVLQAKVKIDSKFQGSVQFSIELTPSIKEYIHIQLGLDLTTSTLPMRWVKGDTIPHVDRGTRPFDTTYLAYLTESAGELVVDGQLYPIHQGSTYAFSEGLSHGTLGTGEEPRLLLGPMSEQGLAVGIGTGLIGNGETDTIYLEQDSGTGDVFYKINDGDLFQFYFPCYVQNTNATPSSYPLKLIFTTNFTLTNTNDYFDCISEGIQFGSTSLNPNGSRPIIEIEATSYEGLIRNGNVALSVLYPSYENINIYNLTVDGDGGTLAAGSGWLCQRYFGRSNNNNNCFIVNCSSSGDIEGGGIVGANAKNITIRGCSSSGDVTGAQGGGIAGFECASIIFESCWSTGAINGNGAGGIVGANTYSATITNCYSEGDILEANSGGILGGNGGIDIVQISNCYSRGDITANNAGGICGSITVTSGTNQILIQNCYTTGNISTSLASGNGGICGIVILIGSGAITLTINHCYTTGTVNPSYETGFIIGNDTTVNGSPGTGIVLSQNFAESDPLTGGSPGVWSRTNADNTLLEVPVAKVGGLWVNPGAAGDPYELRIMGYTPYTVENINLLSELVVNYSQTIEVGQSTQQSLIPGNFEILENAEREDTITINAVTGVISTTSSTPPGLYTLILRNTGSYNITRVEVTVIEAPAAAGGTNQNIEIPNFINVGYEQKYLIEQGQYMSTNASYTNVKQFGSYADYLKYRMANKITGTA